jgi:2-amino-4-hydroxy-6-hydroxymethyldihydropteridine diphosphokinase
MAAHKAYLGLGSNIRPEHFIPVGLDELWQQFGELTISGVYESAAVGFTGPVFHNLVVGLTTDSTLASFARTLRQLEYRHGREPDCDKFSSRTLDIDILTFDSNASTSAGITLPRDEITRNAFVLCPFAEIAPHLVIPNQTQTLAELWRQFDTARQPLTVIPLVWHSSSLPLTGKLP